MKSDNESAGGNQEYVTPSAQSLLVLVLKENLIEMKIKRKVEMEAA